MANVIINSPVWVLDTAATIVGRGVPVRVKGLSWIGAGTAADSLVIKDINGCTVWESVASGANFVDRDAPSFTMEGFVLATISSGRLYVEKG